MERVVRRLLELAGGQAGNRTGLVRLERGGLRKVHTLRFAD